MDGWIPFLKGLLSFFSLSLCPSDRESFLLFFIIFYKVLLQWR